MNHRLLPALVLMLISGVAALAQTLPDFIVQSISVSPTYPLLGSPFTATVVVKNQGTSMWLGGRCDLWLDQPSSQSCGAAGDAHQTLGILAAGATTSLTFDNLTIPQVGTYPLRAFADSQCEEPESNESNNQNLLWCVVVAPDIVVQSITLNPAMPFTGEPFTATVVIKNQGTWAGDGGRCAVWYNATGTQSCGTSGNYRQDIGTLAVGATTTLTFTNLTRVSAGNYTFRAFVDGLCDTTESDEANNQNTLPYTVVDPPDLVVQSITLNPATPVSGLPFSATVVVKNQGTGSGDGGYCDVWKDQSSVQFCGADGNSWHAVGTLAAGATKTLTFTNLTVATAGDYTFRAYVDSQCQLAENDESNNQATLAYTVADLPDFVVQSITLNPATPLAGLPFTATVVLRNQGGSPGVGGWCDIWLDQTTAQSCGASGNTWLRVGTLAAGATSTLTYTNLTRASDGACTFRVFVDSGCETTESDQANNQSTLAYTVVNPPDFIVQSITLNPSTPLAGQPLTASVVVKNQGTGSGNARWCDVWLDQAAAQSCGAAGNTWALLGALEAGATTTLAFTSLTAPAAGSYTFRAFADGRCETTESNEANNQNTLAYTVVAPPNFVVQSITLNPPTPVAGFPFTATVDVKNMGTGSGDGRRCDIWLNQAAAQSCGANGDVWQYTGTLAAGATVTMTYPNLTVASTGSYTFRAFVDSQCGTTESDESNNQNTRSYAVATPAPDFVVQSITLDPWEPGVGQPFTATVVVKNQGTLSGNGGRCDLWVCDWSTRSCGAVGDAWQSVGTLAVGATTTLIYPNLQAPAPGYCGVLAFADSQCQTTESNDSNNQGGRSYQVQPVNLQVRTDDAHFGVRTNRFGFTITGTPGIWLTVQAHTDLAGAYWDTVHTCTLTNGSIYFSDPNWANYERRAYRVRAP